MIAHLRDVLGVPPYSSRFGIGHRVRHPVHGIGAVVAHGGFNSKDCLVEFLAEVPTLHTVSEDDLTSVPVHNPKSKPVKL